MKNKRLFSLVSACVLAVTFCSVKETVSAGQDNTSDHNTQATQDAFIAAAATPGAMLSTAAGCEQKNDKTIKVVAAIIAKAVNAELEATIHEATASQSATPSNSQADFGVQPLGPPKIETAAMLPNADSIAKEDVDTVPAVQRKQRSPDCNSQNKKPDSTSLSTGNNDSLSNAMAIVLSEIYANGKTKTTKGPVVDAAPSGLQRPAADSTPKEDVDTVPGVHTNQRPPDCNSPNKKPDSASRSTVNNDSLSNAMAIVLSEIYANGKTKTTKGPVVDATPSGRCRPTADSIAKEDVDTVPVPETDVSAGTDNKMDRKFCLLCSIVESTKPRWSD
ncbi:MAG: hypothetical protein LBJ38_02295 [Oscillospiraceae bacterium]|jgi:hypothetical protein|nr:hypothetical protein [Oscillospiraceae bacterium]